MDRTLSPGRRVELCAAALMGLSMKHKRLQHVVVVVLALVCLLVTRGGEASVPEGAVAVVNGEAVSRREFGRSLVRRLGTGAIGAFVDRALVEAEADRLGVQINEEELARRRELEVKMRLETLRRHWRVAPQEFESTAKRLGLGAGAIRREIDASVTAGDLSMWLRVEKVLTGRIGITEPEIERYFVAARGKRFIAAHILVSTRRQAHALLESLRESPRSWTRRVIELSLDRTSVPFKGRLPEVPAASELGRALGALKPGELCLWQGEDGWHVLCLIMEIPGSGQKLPEVRHELRRELFCGKAQKAGGLWLAELNEKAPVVSNLSPDPRVRAALGADVVAFVNGEPLRLDDFAEALIEQSGRRMIGPAVEGLLISQEAARRGITVSQESVEKRMDALADELFDESARERGVSVEQFAQELSRKGVAPDGFRRAALGRYIWQSGMRALLLAEKAVCGGVSVTEEDIREAYEALPGERIDAREIVVASAWEAGQICAQHSRGANFLSLMLTRCVEPCTWIHKGLVKNITPAHPYYTHVRHLREGEVSAPFQVGDTYRIVKVVRRHAPQELPPLDSVRQRLIQEVARGKIRKRVRAWVAKLKAEAQIEISL